MKIKKIFLKTIFYFPFYLSIVLIYHVIFYQPFSSYDFIIIPFILSAMTIYINVFDYDKFNEISKVDYLESKHQTKVNYSDELCDTCKHLDKQLPNLKTEVIEYTKERIQYKIHYNILIGQFNSILELKKTNDFIEINIKKQFLGFLPDRGVNLRIIRQLERKFKSLEN